MVIKQREFQRTDVSLYRQWDWCRRRSLLLSFFWILILKWGLYENKMSRKRNNTAHTYIQYTHVLILQTRGQRARVCGHAWQVSEHCKELLHCMVFEKKYYSSLFKIGITSWSKPTRVWHINTYTSTYCM